MMEYTELLTNASDHADNSVGVYFKTSGAIFSSQGYETKLLLVLLGTFRHRISRALKGKSPILLTH